MQGKHNGPPGLEDWEALYPELFARHGGPLTVASVSADAPAPVRELLTLLEAHPLELAWDGRLVVVRETDKAQAAGCLGVVRRCVQLVEEHQEDLARWLAPLLR